MSAPKDAVSIVARTIGEVAVSRIIDCFPNRAFGEAAIAAMSDIIAGECAPSLTALSNTTQAALATIDHEREIVAAAVVALRRGALTLDSPEAVALISIVEIGY